MMVMVMVWLRRMVPTGASRVPSFGRREVCHCRLSNVLGADSVQGNDTLPCQLSSVGIVVRLRQPYDPFPRDRVAFQDGEIAIVDPQCFLHEVFRSSAPMPHATHATRNGLDRAAVSGQQHGAALILVRADDFANEMAGASVVLPLVLAGVDVGVDGRVRGVDVEFAIGGDVLRRNERQRSAGVPRRTLEETFEQQTSISLSDRHK